MKLPQCAFLCPNTKLCCLQQCWHQDQAFSKAITCAKHRYCQCCRQVRANKSKHTVHLLSILPLCSEIQGLLFPDKCPRHYPSPRTSTFQSPGKSTRRRTNRLSTKLWRSCKTKGVLGKYAVGFKAVGFCQEVWQKWGWWPAPSHSSWRSGWRSALSMQGGQLAASSSHLIN